MEMGQVDAKLACRYGRAVDPGIAKEHESVLYAELARRASSHTGDAKGWITQVVSTVELESKVKAVQRGAPASEQRGLGGESERVQDQVARVA